MIVQSRDGVMLLNITEEYVVPKTHIITDCWNSCKAICKTANNNIHSMVNHSENFVGNFNLLTPKSNTNLNPNP